MIALQARGGLVFWPESEIACWTPEFRNRWQVVRSTGEVAHCPTPPPAGPWVAFGPHYVQPRWLRLSSMGWMDPANFLVGSGELPQASEPPLVPLVPGLPCNLDQVFMVSRRPHEDTHWTTDLGEFTTPRTTDEELRRLHPDLFRVSFHRYFNRRQLRRVEGAGLFFRLFFRDGQEILERRDSAIPKQLGLRSFSYLEPKCMGLYSGVSVRDWPLELATASADFLRSNFETPLQLMANLAWQAFRWRTIGIPIQYGRTHREFWYVPLVTTLERAGFLSSRQARWRVDDDNPNFAQARKLYLAYQQMLGDFVLPKNFFTLRQFGFKESRPELRQIGDRLPHILVVAEKESLKLTLDRLHQELGVSTLLLSGQPSLLGSEYLAEALRQFAPVIVLALVDLDPSGWNIAAAVVRQLLHFHLPVRGPAQIIARAQDFTAEEIELFSMPCLSFTPQDRTMAKNWLAKGGGIAGEATTLCVNHFRPYARIKARVEQMLPSLG